jgi:integrase
MARRIGQIKQRGEKTFLVRVFLGHSDNGKRHYFNRTVRGTKKDADKVLMEIIRRRDAGEPLEDAKHIFSAYAEEWLQAKAASVRSNTVENYRYLLTRYVFPKLGNRKLNGVESTEVSALYAGLAKQGLSGATMQMIHNILNGIFKQAHKARLLRFNPLTAVERPRHKRKEMRTLREGEAKAFLEAVKGTPEECLFTFLLTTGCRPSEALGLQWGDLRFEAATITIQRTLKKKHGEWKCDAPKTTSGLRTITLPGEMLTRLRNHRRAQNEARLKAGREWVGNGFIFTDDFGRPRGLGMVRLKFKQALQRAGLPDIRLYDTRHTSATLLMESGVSAKVVSERLGHSDVGITLDTYSHVTQQLQQQAADRIGAALFG